MIPLWVKLKANLLGREILVFYRIDGEREYRFIKKILKDLAWGHPDQIYEDRQGNRYYNNTYVAHAEIH